MDIVTFKVNDFLRDSQILLKYKDTYGYIKEYNTKWLQLVKENPYMERDDLALILTIDDNVAVGEIVLLSGAIKINGIKDRVIWLGPFFLEKEYKNSGAGAVMILKTLSFANSISKGVVQCGGGKEVRELYKSIGMKELGPLRKFIYFYSAEPILHKFIKIKPILKFLSIFLTPALKLYYVLKMGKLKQVLEYKTVSRFSKNIEEIIERKKANFFPRDEATLNWVIKLSGHPVIPFEIYSGTRLIGYCLLRVISLEGTRHNLPKIAVGELLDYMFDDEAKENKKDLLIFAINYFRDKGIEIFLFQHCDDEFTVLCKKFGMIRLGGHSVYFRPPEKINLAPGDEWFLTGGTSDAIF